MAAPESTPSAEPAGRVFVTTHWSVVLRAREKNSPDSQAALECLCRTYWPPLYAFVRREVWDNVAGFHLKRVTVSAYK